MNKGREFPVMCIECKDCGQVFHAIAMLGKYHEDKEANSELLMDLCDYARQGHTISFREKDKADYSPCEHIICAESNYDEE